MNKIDLENLLIRYAVDEILSSCDDTVAFYQRLLICESQEDFETICEDLDVAVWEPFEDEDHECIFYRIEDKITCFKSFIEAYENLKTKE